MEVDMRVPAGKTVDSRAFDRSAMDAGIPSAILMENAAFSVYLEIRGVIDEFVPEKVVVFAGSGGNGGDGFVLLRILADRDPSLPLFLVETAAFKEENKNPGNAAWANRCLLPEKVRVISDLSEISGKVLFVDAMLGTGLRSDLAGAFLEAAEFINAYDRKKKYVAAVDVPTGLDCDTGRIMGCAVKADLTVTMGIYKTGLFAEKGPDCCGKIVLGHISATQSVRPETSYFVEEDPQIKLVEAEIDGYKNKNGHLLVIGGDIEKLGASIISAESFMACGGGLVTAAFRKELLPLIAGRMPGLMLIDAAEIPSKLNSFSAIVIGPGLSEIPFDFSVLRSFDGTMVVDAGMFDLLSKNKDLLETIKDRRVVFTPHQGELRRFLKADRNEPWLSQVERFPLEKNHILVAKSHAPFVRSCEKTVIVPQGARALAFGGSGDALTGVLAYETFFHGLFEGAVNAVIRHRAAGIGLEKRWSPRMHNIMKLVEMVGMAGEK